MNKSISLFIVLLLSITCWSQKGIYIAGHTRIEMGYPHAGFYSKERPSFAVEQTFSTPVANKLSIGIGTGFAIYPDAYTLPVFLMGYYRINIRRRYISWGHRIGANLSIGEKSFFGYRYNTTVHYHIPLSRKITAHAGIGANYLWNPLESRSLSGVTSVGIIYKFINTKRSNEKKGRPERYKSTPWF